MRGTKKVLAAIAGAVAITLVATGGSYADRPAATAGDGAEDRVLRARSAAPTPPTTRRS